MSIEASDEMLTSQNQNIDIVVKMTKNKVIFYRDVLQKTYIHVNKNKGLDILGNLDINRCVNIMGKIAEKIDYLELEIETSSLSIDSLITQLQNINNDMSNILKTYGTTSLEDLLCICFGSSNLFLDITEEYKYDVLKKYFHPVSYKTNCKPSDKTTTSETEIADVDKECIPNLECHDILNESKVYHMKIHGMRLYFYHRGLNKHIYVYGIVDDILVKLMNEKYIKTKISNINKFVLKDNPIFNRSLFDRFMASRILKEYLIHNHSSFYELFVGYNTDSKMMLSKSLSGITHDFLNQNVYYKRKTLIQLLVSIDSPESKYMCYLLYDLLSNDADNKIDTEEQIKMMNSFPHSIRGYFNEAMKETIKYTNELTTYDINKIPYEQQICLINTNNNVKEKAMTKLKEIKAKSEDSGSKARQYLDGLLKIPFGVLKKEPIMGLMDKNSKELAKLITEVYPYVSKIVDITIKEEYTSLEIVRIIKQVKDVLLKNTFNEDVLTNLYGHITSGTKTDIIHNIDNMNKLLMTKAVNDGNHDIKQMDIISLNKSKEYYKNQVKIHIEGIQTMEPKLIEYMNYSLQKKKYPKYISQLEIIENRMHDISKYMINVKEVLNDSVHGHDKAKTQIERIIGQWINGKQDGYCFGFEGPPGIGKTSLSKYGLSKCLIDDQGNSRPFSMIAIGGDANGSSLHGHNYTYVGSSWGAIVQILMDKNCMNPIIFIDELDKISKTENGREIIGILTHLLDPTQNDSFQDKYFHGIDLDLSKVLFILSYNDVESIDRILLDRIHRIKFGNLSLKEKVFISSTHLLPNIYEKMGLKDMIIFQDDVLSFIIENYTLEPGVRKLKEKLFEIVSEINLNILKSDITTYEYPINITIDDIKDTYFKDSRNIRIKMIHSEDRVGYANGMWANAVGQGGTLPIEASLYPSSNYLQLKLTGMQGDVMQESMNVALTIAYRLTSEKRRKELTKKYDSEHKWGIHLHTPSASDHKNGPSAGSCITTTIYSLLNDKKVKHEYALTGEITLDGSVTEIGGLDLKILGSIKAGVKKFIYPKENQKDADALLKKYKDEDILTGIELYPVSKIEEVFALIFD